MKKTENSKLMNRERQILRIFAVDETSMERMTERRGREGGELGGRDRAENPSKDYVTLKI